MYRQRLLKPIGGVLGVDGGPEIDDEGQDVKGKDESDNPLEDGGGILLVSGGEGTKQDDENELGGEEGELEPEGDSEKRVLAVLDSEALVFPTGADGRGQIAADEDDEESVMLDVMHPSVKDGEEDKTAAAETGEDDGQGREEFFGERAVGQ